MDGDKGAWRLWPLIWLVSLLKLFLIFSDICFSEAFERLMVYPEVVFVYIFYTSAGTYVISGIHPVNTTLHIAN